MPRIFGVSAEIPPINRDVTYIRRQLFRDIGSAYVSKATFEAQKETILDSIKLLSIEIVETDSGVLINLIGGEKMSQVTQIDTDKLKNYLSENEVSSGEIITATDFSITSVSQFMNGYKYSEMFFRRLADFLGLTFDDFIDKFERK